MMCSELESGCSASTIDKVSLSAEKSDTESVKEDHDESLNDEEAEKDINKLLNNVNYATLLAFIDKFGPHLSIKEITLFKNLELNIVNKKTGKFFLLLLLLLNGQIKQNLFNIINYSKVNRKFLEIHINLLRNLNSCRHVKKDKWEYYLAKVRV